MFPFVPSDCSGLRVTDASAQSPWPTLRQFRGKHNHTCFWFRAYICENMERTWCHSLEIFIVNSYLTTGVLFKRLTCLNSIDLPKHNCCLGHTGTYPRDHLQQVRDLHWSQWPAIPRNLLAHSGSWESKDLACVSIILLLADWATLSSSSLDAVLPLLEDFPVLL